MRKRYLISLFALAAVVLVPALHSVPSLADSSADVIAEGKRLAFDRQKGNCLSCHLIEDGVMPGTHGPPPDFHAATFRRQGETASPNS